MWLWCEIANRYYGNRKGNKSLVLLEWGNDGGGEVRPKPFLRYYPQFAVSLTPWLSHFLWSPPVGFVFSPLIAFIVSFTSLALCVSLRFTVCLSVCLPCEMEVWETAGLIRGKRVWESKKGERVWEQGDVREADEKGGGVKRMRGN